MREQRPAPRLAGDDGSIIAEFAFILPFLVTVALGIFEFGIAYRNRNTIHSSVRAGARVGAQLGKDGQADRQNLMALWAAISKFRNSTVDRVVIWRVNDPNGTIPSSCRNLTPSPSGTGINNLCNVYSGNQVRNASIAVTSFTNSCSSGWDHWWCPSSRSDTLTGAGPDWLGVYIVVNYTPVTKVLPWSPLVMTDQTVVRIEPKLT